MCGEIIARLGRMDELAADIITFPSELKLVEFTNTYDCFAMG